MNIEIICPIYNAEKYILELDKSLKKQQNVNIYKILYILTQSDDNTEAILNQINANYNKINKKDFSHSIVREKAALESNADIVVFITQDIYIEDNLWLYNLVKDIDDKEIVATYSRQISKYNNIEKYTREYNYSNYDIVKTKDDIEKIGLKTFFFSDASSAISTKIFKKLGGYDGKNLPINEDMYIAYKIIMRGYKIKYCSKSIVYHSHNFTLKELYMRYKLIGEFFKENKYFEDYSITENGIDLAKYILKRIIQEKRFFLLLRYPFDMIARLLGMKVGKK